MDAAAFSVGRNEGAWLRAAGAPQHHCHLRSTVRSQYSGDQVQMAVVIHVAQAERLHHTCQREVRRGGLKRAIALAQVYAHRPPDAVAAYTMLVLLSTTVKSSMRPPMLAGPISRNFRLFRVSTI